MKTDGQVLLRLTEDYVSAILDQLDHESASPMANARKSERHAYRARVIVEWLAPEGSQRATVATRNLSRTGVAFLTTRFVYPGTRCRARLISALNIAQVVDATVVRCRYLSNTTGVHEVGCQFDKAIDVTIFQPAACTPKVLLAGFEPSRANLFSILTKRLQTQVNSISSLEDCAKSVADETYDIVLMDFDRDCGSCDFARRQRELGYFRPLVSLTLRDVDDAAEKCRTEECDACVLARVHRDDLVPLIDGVRLEPVVSDHAGDATVRPLIDEFVHTLPALVKAIETAYREHQDAALIDVVQQLRLVADTTGFDAISAACDRLCGDGKIPESTVERRNRLAHLVQVCLGARLASGGGSAD
ncbi:MAG: PilZ domain-containing protein [Phycisphaerae bacterium]